MKGFWVVTAVLAALLASCATGKKTTNDISFIKLEREVPGNAPKPIKDAVRKAPKDALVAVGNAKVTANNAVMARTAAESRARVEIARQINKVTTELVRYYSVKSKIDPSDEVIFKERITVSLTQAVVKNASPVAHNIDKDDNYWVVLMMYKSDIIEHISGVQKEARDTVPAMASFNAEELINTLIK